MTGSPPPNIPPLLQLHQSSPTINNEQLEQQNLLLMQLQGNIHSNQLKQGIFRLERHFQFLSISDLGILTFQINH